MTTPADSLTAFIDANPRLTVLSGAGCSTASGIPAYRDDQGQWKSAKPVQISDFLNSASVRRRYWARSYAGWSRVERAKPNAAHLALAKLERHGRVECLVTQNVDNLHREAGSLNIVDLHGVLHKVRCLDCNEVAERNSVQRLMAASNPDWHSPVIAVAPDGDAELAQAEFHRFNIPFCQKCGGLIKPDVVFFGEAVPRQRVERVSESINRSDGLLVVGSSLMVWSGYRFARKAVAMGKALAIVNRGKTRADDIAQLSVRDDCAVVLTHAAQRL